MLKKKAKVITISGGKGGTGKSFVSVNLAVELAKSLPVTDMNMKKMSNSRVLLFDADYHLSNSHLFLGLRQTSYLDKAMSKPQDIVNYIVTTDFGIDLISFGGDDKKILGSDMKFNDKILAELVHLEELYDFIIVDTGAGLNRLIINQILYADNVVLVVNPESTSLLDAYKVIKFIAMEKHRPKSIDICVNKVVSMDEAVATFGKLEATKNQFGVKMNIYLSGSVYADKQLFDLAMQKGIPAVIIEPASHFVQSFSSLAKAVQRANIAKKVDSFFEKIFIEYRQ